MSQGIGLDSHRGLPADFGRSAATHLARTGVSALLCFGTLVIPLAGAQAQGSAAVAADAAPTTNEYSIPPGPLGTVLSQFAGVAGVVLSFDAALTAGKTSSGLRGRFSVDEGFAQILKDQGLLAVRGGEGSYSLLVLPPIKDGATLLPAVNVTATAETRSSELPKPYAGGQVARGGQLGLLGNRDVMDTPFTTTAYTEQLIRDQQARKVTEVLANDASVRVTQPPNINETYTIRGFNQSAGDIGFEGLPGVIPEDSISVAALERVEIIKGPSALLSGIGGSFTGTLGGAINLVPKRAGSEPLTRFIGSYGADSQFGGQIDAGRRFGADDRIGTRVNLIHRGGDTPVDGLSDRYTLAAVDLDYSGDRWRVWADLFYQDRYFDSFIRNTAVTPGLEVPKAPDASNNWQSGAGAADGYFGALRGEFDINDAWTAHAAFGGRNVAEKFSFGFETISNEAGDIDATQILGSTSSVTQSSEVGVIGKFSTGDIQHQVSVSAGMLESKGGFGFSFGDSLTNNIYHPVRYPTPSLAGVTRDPPKSSDDTFETAAIADTISWDQNRFQITAGGRLQKIEQCGFDSTSGDKTCTYDKQSVSPAIGLLFRPITSVSLFANYIEGLLPGDTAPVGSANAGKQFAPYRTKQYETGAKFDSGTLLTTLSLFQIARPVSITDPVSKIFSSDGEQRHRGVELNTAGEVAQGWRMLGGASYINGKLVKTAGGVDQGNDAVGVPELQVNLGVEWDTSWLEGLTLSSRVVYTTSQYLDTANTQQIPSWTRLDTGARYKLLVGGMPMSFNASLLNALDADYWETAANDLSLAAPRTLWLSVSSDF